MKKISPEKWGDKAQVWWENLTLEQKQHYKKHFQAMRDCNNKRTCPYPSMYNTNHLRISQLTRKHIHRIWVFKDHELI